MNVHNIPMEFWIANALGKISSRVGTPIMIDLTTYLKKKLNFARILIAINPTKEPSTQLFGHYKAKCEGENEVGVNRIGFDKEKVSKTIPEDLKSLLKAKVLQIVGNEDWGNCEEKACEDLGDKDSLDLESAIGDPEAEHFTRKKKKKRGKKSSLASTSVDHQAENIEADIPAKPMFDLSKKPSILDGPSYALRHKHKTSPKQGKIGGV
ncbi:hypothetical protein C2S53_011196 [Perilla frutescens var. hirtella]|uniref:Uncharacterized protein n=1 Tax=Perilla frutescens var. hirtella TaxID=608512 RepID=A0AAD4IN40_PERFH|nr:hypothetical protein C2S53_011196 [Perilla frutescens var. hirtella]